METALIFHLPSKNSQSAEDFEKSLKSFFSQTNEFYSMIGLANSESLELREEYTDRIRVLTFEQDNLALQLNLALDELDTDFVMYVNNEANPVILKDACNDMYLLAAYRNTDAGMIYGEYELADGDNIKEIHLLHHHIGRLRDNQDYGKVFLFDRDAIDRIYGFDESLDYHALYDIRLKISENNRLIRLANKYSGALYRVIAAGKEANVFDYLLAGKEAQLEAEAVVTEHLKRIHAYLIPAYGYRPRPVEKTESELIASIVIPVNNRPEFIGTAIDSIQAQTIKEVEAIIVVNGGPDDATIPEVKRYLEDGDLYNSDKPSVKLIVVDVNNIGFCLNMGVRHARGKYYVQLDSDDRLKPKAVEKIVAEFENNPTNGMVIGSYEVWEKKTKKVMRMKDIPVVTHDEWTDDNGRNNLLRINGAGAPRAIPFQIIKEMGYFGINDDPYALNYGEDYDMVLHISEKYRIGRIYEPIYDVIRHAGGTDHNIDQVTIDRNDEAKDHMRREAINRRRYKYATR